MIEFAANQLTAQQNYKFLTGSVIPRPIAWITTQNVKTGVINAAPFSYFNVVASNPPLVSLSINRRQGMEKDTAHNLRTQKEGVIHIVSDSILDDMNQSAASLPPEISELTDSSLTLSDSQKVAVPGIKEAPIKLEVRLHQYVPVLDHQERITSDLFVLEVLHYTFDESVFDENRQYILPKELGPIARLAGNTYGTLGDTFDVIRPY
ncbi:flavin reductase family protein [Enterococcus asini]|uniref:flavin reductase family protein n=1 Tax=Enterococcus asini TaxID=57732 RepID=UPI00288E6891|nr:flavin reductase family protein [Enterococcus asini]MDT2756001.1 flavin reductase family protein [Enterococcus asini]